MNREEIVNSPEYKAIKAALKWWYSLPEEQREATDIDVETDIVDAYTEGVIYGWNNPQWIPVEERMPEEDGRYWCCDDDDGQEELIWKDGNWYGLLDPYPIEGITHWMPLPQPPRKEE